MGLEIIETEKLLKQEPTVQELIEEKRDREIQMRFTPCELKLAIENGDYDYNDFTDNMKKLLDVVNLEDCNDT